MTPPNSENSGRFALASARVVAPEGIGPAAVIVAGETIEAVVPRDAAILDGLPVEDLGERVIMPGLVDTHVHINEPGRTDWEGYATATRAAAAGGVTTVVDMPLNCIPVTTSVAALEAKRQACAGKLSVDTGYWGGVIGQDDAELAALTEAGVLGAKAFLCPSGIDEFPSVDEAQLRRGMAVLAAAGLPLLAHAEIESPVEDDSMDPRTYASYLASRPERWELDAIELLIRLSRETGCAVHIVHLSAASAIPVIAQARAEGLAVSVETCPHYLSLAAESIAAGATHFKCAPPIREQANQDLLWRGLEDGHIDMVVSDHSPCTPALKQLERGDFGQAWGGIASLQLTLPLAWTAASARGVGLAQLYQWLCVAPAKLAGLEASKGRLAPGCDADLCVWDPDASLTVDGATMYMRHDLTPYQGQTLLGAVERTYLRGQLICEAGVPLGPPRGRELLRGRP